jgi:hypothetical protein
MIALSELPDTRQGRRAYSGLVSTEGEPVADRVVTAAARTVGARTARVYAARSAGSPVPDARDRRGEGVTDFPARRTCMWEVPFSERLATEIFDLRGDDNTARQELSEPHELIYDGANTFIRVAGRWTAFFLDDHEDPRDLNDPPWPLDALFGARDDAVESGPDVVRGVAVTRYRVTVDLARADAAVPAGVSAPAGPYRALRQLSADMWLDGAGLIRRAAVNTEMRAVGGEKPTWAVCELWDFGIAVDIRQPLPDEITVPGEVNWGTSGPGA